MERLPVEVSLKIFSLLDHQNLATAQLVCRKWRILASEDSLWSNLFRERWGLDRAMFFAPEGSKLWQDVYVVQDRGDRVGLGLKIIREGDDYYLVHQGEIQRHLGTRRPETGEIYHSSSTLREEEFSNGEEPCSGHVSLEHQCPVCCPCGISNSCFVLKVVVSFSVFTSLFAINLKKLLQPNLYNDAIESGVFGYSPKSAIAALSFLLPVFRSSLAVVKE
ncbi:hypothetical protein ACH5RR_017270 [Cinchona calisaya]|uniref:F-box protein n=1 Tax=Cinchona calisaya TaxID=153742 RepID=A0ABD2ZYA3_9GENT